MAEPESLLGVGLALVGIGGPATVALLRLWPSRSNNRGVTPEQCEAKHEAQDELFSSRLETFEQKVINVDNKVESVRTMTTQILAIVETRSKGR